MMSQRKDNQPGNTSVVTGRSVAAEILARIKRAPNQQKAMEDTVALLKLNFPKYTWVGFYILDGNELVIGPYLGKPTPHTRIALNRGICGAAVSQKQTIIVEDVHSDPRYLACSIETKSEIVVPIVKGDRILGEIDIDSDLPAAFNQSDRKLLEEIAQGIAQRF